MSVFPLAVYTAEHGLAWFGAKSRLPFAALDACRKALGPLPDFDAGEKGYEGVWVTAERVFALRCQSVAGSDFRGRAATWLAVTWVPRAEAPGIDFERLLACEALRAPVRPVPEEFACEASLWRGAAPVEGTPQRLGDFSQAGAVAASLPRGVEGCFRRGLGERSVMCRYKNSVRMPESFGPSYAPIVTSPSFSSVPEDGRQACPGAPGSERALHVAALALASVALVAALALAGASGWLWRKGNALEARLAQVEEQVSRLETRVSQLEQGSAKPRRAPGRYQEAQPASGFFPVMGGFSDAWSKETPREEKKPVRESAVKTEAAHE